MKLINTITEQQILELGFFPFNCKDESDDTPAYYFKNFAWEYNLGAGRRGQYYTLYIALDNTLHIYASEPDGSGTSTALDDIFKKLFEQNLIE